MDKYEFDAIIEVPDNTPGAYVKFPLDPMTCFGKKNLIPIECTFDGMPYRGSIANMGAGPCIGVLKAIREQLGKGPGDSVHVVVWQDTSPRTVETPPDLAAALKGNPDAAAAWERLSFSHQREHVKAITSARKAETREARIHKTIEALSPRKA
jgi:hypothetical protein